MASKKATNLQDAYAAMVEFPEGREVLRHIFNLCGYDKPLLTVNSGGEVNMQASMYNLARRDIWLDIRQHLGKVEREWIEVGGDDTWTTQEQPQSEVLTPE